MHKQSAYLLVLAVGTLTLIGIVMLFSTGAYAPDNHGDEFSFLKKQSFWLGVGLTGVVVCSVVDYHWWQKTWHFWLGASIVLLTLCFIRPIGMRLNGSSRWVHAGPLTFQPSELAKLASVMFIAWWFSREEEVKRKFLQTFAFPFAVIGVILLLIITETDLGSTLLIGGTVLLMMFVAGTSLRYLGPLVLSGLVGLLAVAWRISERQSRLLAFLNPEKYQETEGHQQLMGLIAFGSGGIDGLGLGNGRQKMLYLPYAHTDFIFPVIGEELGLKVTLLVVFCYLLVLTAGILISLNAKDRFGMLAGFGLTTILALQAAINIGVTTSLLPNKGLPLPYISYGGSNLFFSLVCVGILINIYRQGKDTSSSDKTRLPVRIRHLKRI
ncbi:MAG: putative lipid II flippase FtsW [Verrucomicrobia bacterium]|nr:putative lipid II flippase FtsW [Verrucomicrobiota bacterium]